MVKALADRMFEARVADELPSSRSPRGLVLDIGGHYKNVFTLAQLLDITRAEIDLGIALLDDVVTTCAEA